MFLKMKKIIIENLIYKMVKMVPVIAKLDISIMVNKIVKSAIILAQLAGQVTHLRVKRVQMKRFLID